MSTSKIHVNKTLKQLRLENEHLRNLLRASLPALRHCYRSSTKLVADSNTPIQSANIDICTQVS